MSLQITLSVIGAATAILCAALVGVWYAHRTVARKGVPGGGSCFINARTLTALAAGILIGGGLMHLLPEGQEDLGELMEFPLANALCAAGFMLPLLLESLLPAACVSSVSLFASLLVHSIFEGISMGISAQDPTACACTRARRSLSPPPQLTDRDSRPRRAQSGRRSLRSARTSPPRPWLSQPAC